MEHVESSAAEERRLREEGGRIERLLEELNATAGPATWKKVEELVQRLVGLYGAGLARVLSQARDAGAHEEFDARLAGDELVSHLLLLHGLHPLGPAERIERALDRVRPYLGSHGGAIEVVAFEEGALRLRLQGTCNGCPSSAGTVEQLIRRAVEDAAPEVARIEVESAKDTPLVKLKVEGANRAGGWTEVRGLEGLAANECRPMQVAERELIFVRHEENLLAFRDACGVCRAPLGAARVEGNALICAGCESRFDLSRAGQALEPAKAMLRPVPLLRDAAGVRISLEPAE